MTTITGYVKVDGELLPLPGGSGGGSSQSVSVARTKYTATGAVTAGTTLSCSAFTVGKHLVRVSWNGLMLAEGVGFNEAASGSITLTFDLAEGDEVDIDVLTLVGFTSSVTVSESRSEVLSAGAVFTVPEHEVGFARCTVFLDGLYAREGLAWQEESATSISFLEDIPADMEILVFTLT